jgi:hypothetical protein
MFFRRILTRSKKPDEEETVPEETGEESVDPGATEEPLPEAAPLSEPEGPVPEGDPLDAIPEPAVEVGPEAVVPPASEVAPDVAPLSVRSEERSIPTPPLPAAEAPAEVAARAPAPVRPTHQRCFLCNTRLEAGFCPTCQMKWMD